MNISERSMISVFQRHVDRSFTHCILQVRIRLILILINLDQVRKRRFERQTKEKKKAQMYDAEKDPF